MTERDPKHFFMAFVPPTATKQEKQVSIGRDGRPRFYPSPAWSAAEADLRAHLEPFRPSEPIRLPLILEATWCFPANGHADGEPYAKRPDTDNLQKGLKDVMTSLGWWRDDALVFSEHVTKVYARIPGIRIDIEEVEI